MPETGALEQHKIKLENYYGPLDLLLYLVKEDEVDVLAVRLTEVVEQYVTLLEAARELDMDVAGEFIVISSQLMLLKSRRVVPAAAPTDAEAGAEEEEEEISVELIRKLLEYKRFKDLAVLLEERGREMERRHARPAARVGIGGDDDALPEADLWQLVKAFARVSQQVRLSGELSIVYQDIPIERIIQRILEKVSSRTDVGLKELIGDRRDRLGVVGNLLALLELVKRQVLEYRQSEEGEILLSLRRGELDIE